MEWYGSNQKLIRGWFNPLWDPTNMRFRPFFFEKPLVKNTFFKSFPKKNAEIVNLKNPDFDFIRRIHPECGFYGFMIRFWICPPKTQNPFLDFPEKTHPNIHASSNGVSKKSNCWLCRVLTTLTMESALVSWKLDCKTVRIFAYSSTLLTWDQAQF